MINRRAWRNGWRIGLGAAMAAGMLSLGGCNRRQAMPAFAPPPPLVVVATAKAQDVPDYLDEIGKAVALESVTITPRVDGQITQRHFVDGANVKLGQPLFTIDPNPFDAALEAAQAQLQVGNAALEFASGEFKRYQGMLGTQAISQTDYDTKKNAVEVAKAQVAADEAAVKAAKINRAFCDINSPLAGRAGARLVDVGNVVKANSGALLSIQKLDPIYVDFTVNEQDLTRVRKNMADGTLKTLARLPDDQGEGRVGSLTFLDNSVQDASGTIRLRATIPNKDLHFWPGQFTKVRLVLRTLKNAVLTPASAPQIGQQGSFVFVIKDDSTAEQRPVTLGQTQGNWIVIDKGLEAGERVVIDGQLTVRNGGPVRVAPPAPAPAQIGAAAPTSSTAQVPLVETDKDAAHNLLSAQPARAPRSAAATSPAAQPASAAGDDGGEK